MRQVTATFTLMKSLGTEDKNNWKAWKIMQTLHFGNRVDNNLLGRNNKQRKLSLKMTKKFPQKQPLL